MEETIKILAIDPGTTQSGFVVWNGKTILDYGKIDNAEILDYLVSKPYTVLVIEKIVSYGKSVGQSTFDTVFWSGRFFQVAVQADIKTELIIRREVRLYHCDNDTKAKDANVIQALKDRFEPDLQPRKKPKGILKGITEDVWQALALAVFYYDKITQNYY